MSVAALPEIASFLSGHGLREVECVFPDAAGVARGKRMPAASFAAGQELRIAQAVTMQGITGDYPEHEIFPDQDPDVRLVPDFSTLRRVPWSPAAAPRAIAVHDCLELDGQACDFASRGLLRRVLRRYADHGLAPVVAPEIEFYLTSPHVDPNEPYRAPAGRQGLRECGQSAFGMASLGDLGAFWDELGTALETLGVRGDTWIHEVGLGQFEINLVHGEPLALADQAFYFKLATREVAAKQGLQANFMAKPMAGQPGSSMHLHQSVLDAEGRNIFSDESGAETPRFHQFLAGLQAHLPALMLVFAPYVNSYRRFLRHSQAPVSAAWGRDNRTTALRVPRSVPAARRVENRVAGADANPYLVVAASLAAGLAGLEDGLAPTPPLEGSAYEGEPRRDLPRNLDEAIDLFAASPLAARMFGERFVTGFVALKHCEVDHWQREVSPWERRYLGPAV